MNLQRSAVTAALMATVVAASVFLLPQATKATTILYDLTLTPTSPSSGVGATGTFTIEGPILGSGTDIFSDDPAQSTSGNADLLSLNLTMADGSTFDIHTNESSSLPYTLVTFLDGAIQSFQSLMDTGGNLPGLTLFPFGEYHYFDSSNTETIGTIRADQVGTTPLPAAVWLFGSVLAGWTCVNAWRSRRNRRVVGSGDLSIA